LLMPAMYEKEKKLGLMFILTDIYVGSHLIVHLDLIHNNKLILDTSPLLKVYGDLIHYRYPIVYEL